MKYSVMPSHFVLRQIPLLVSLWAGVAGVAIGQTTAPAGAAADRVLPLEVVINGQKSGTWPLIERDGILMPRRRRLRSGA